MAEKSIFWQTGLAGDGLAPYTEAEIFQWIKRTFLTDPTAQGVIKNYANALAVSGSATPLTVATGAAVVNGVPYENDASFTLPVPTPTLGTTGKRVVLRADYAANTVRVIVITSADGVSAFPALTQNGSFWDISLASLSVTTGGVITVADERQYARFNTVVDDIHAGNRIPQFYRRQGGDPTDWDDAGTTDYTPGKVRMQAGRLDVTVAAGDNILVTPITVTFPVPFSAAPLIFVTPRFVGTPPDVVVLSPSSIFPDHAIEFELRVRSATTTHGGFTFSVNWLAIGPE